jgi:uncharacterized iron-regulated membrane protein
MTREEREAEVRRREAARAEAKTVWRALMAAATGVAAPLATSRHC